MIKMNYNIPTCQYMIKKFIYKHNIIIKYVFKNRFVSFTDNPILFINSFLL
jgi:hypothetical protein